MSINSRTSYRCDKCGGEPAQVYQVSTKTLGNGEMLETQSQHWELCWTCLDKFKKIFYPFMNNQESK